MATNTAAKSRRRRFLTVTTTVLAVSVMGVAFAAWTADGTGAGQASARTHQAVSINGDATVADLFPGDVQDLSVTIDNGDNPYNIRVDSITVALASGEDTKCGVEDLTFGTYSISSGALVVAGGGTATVTLDDAVSMGHLVDNSCQGVAWDLALSFEGESTGLPVAGAAGTFAN